MPLWPQAIGELSAYIPAGRIKWRALVAEGIKNASAAFFSMLKGGNFGKQLVRLA